MRKIKRRFTSAFNSFPVQLHSKCRHCAEVNWDFMGVISRDWKEVRIEIKEKMDNFGIKDKILNIWG